MKPFLLATLAFLTFSGAAVAQTDSLTVAHTKWKTERIAPGVKLRRAHFNDNLFSSSQNISIVEIKQKRRNELKIGFEPKQLLPTSTFGQREQAIAAINGTFFDVKNGGSVDFIKAAGNVINENRLSKSGARAIHQKAAVAIEKGKLSLAEWNGEENWEAGLKASDVMLSGPLLLTEGNLKTLDTTAFVTARHPRSAVATKGKKVFFITVDGRQANAAGMSLPELSRFLSWIKLSNAVNLDGGGSTTLWIGKYPDNGVINYPSDNKKWDHFGERKVANVLLVKRRSRR